MFKLILITLAVTLSVAQASSINSRVWTVTCRNYRCEDAFQYCVATKCNSKKNCYDCIDKHYPECNTCLNEFFHPDQFVKIENENYLICDNDDPLQKNACKFYCRGEFSFKDELNQCGRLNRFPVCFCNY